MSLVEQLLKANSVC